MDPKKQRYITAGVAVAAAAATAHLMQGGGSEPQQAAMVAPISAAAAAPVVTPDATPGVAGSKNEVTVLAAVEVPIAETAAEPAPTAEAEAALAGDVPHPPRDMLVPVLPDVGTDLKGRIADTEAPAAAPIVPNTARNEFGLTCGPILSASAAEGAMVRLTLTAPCRGEEPVTVRQGDLVFSAKLDKLGTLSLSVPALSAQAEFTVVFPDGAEAGAMAEVPGMDAVERVALVQRGDAGLQIHALEFGAGYDTEGHVWAGAPRDADTAARLGGGYMTVLGDASLDQPYMAQVYTWPASAHDGDGVIRLSVEAEVTAYNCDTEVAGQIIEPGAGPEVTTIEMTVSMPDCSAVGEYLVLKNLLRDLRIASN